ncbi:hypothetical protein [Dyella sedimenti]|uniref:hypothetical protein n=1 Tax=Dyella sedimenti TaxID=2919947 RepID=UPI001FA9E181|nr:hypothetical protein [Dyella sedimenti]
MKSIYRKLVIVASLLLLVGCSAMPTKPGDTAPSVVYNKPVAEVQKAVVDALMANGFVVGTSRADYIEGARPHKVGLLVGSGGESAGVWLSAIDSSKTSVKVSTAKSLAGIAGQKNWDKEIIAEIDKSIGPHK